MSKFLVIGLLVVGFAAVVGGMLVLMARGAAQWRRKMDDLLLPIGFERQGNLGGLDNGNLRVLRESRGHVDAKDQHGPSGDQLHQCARQRSRPQSPVLSPACPEASRPVS